MTATVTVIPADVHEVTTWASTWYREPGTEDWTDRCGTWVTTGQLQEMQPEWGPL